MREFVGGREEENVRVALTNALSNYEVTEKLNEGQERQRSMFVFY